jgi:hypothetical protein
MPRTPHNVGPHGAARESPERKQGQAQQAAAVLDQWVWKAEGPFFVLGRLDRGRIAEGLGERQKAIDSYQFVADVWRRADPELQSFVVEARNGLARLRRD